METGPGGSRTRLHGVPPAFVTKRSAGGTRDVGTTAAEAAPAFDGRFSMYSRRHSPRLPAVPTGRPPARRRRVGREAPHRGTLLVGASVLSAAFAGPAAGRRDPPAMATSGVQEASFRHGVGGVFPARHAQGVDVLPHGIRHDSRISNREDEGAGTTAAEAAPRAQPVARPACGVRWSPDCIPPGRDRAPGLPDARPRSVTARSARSRRPSGPRPTRLRRRRRSRRTPRRRSPRR